MEKSYFPNKHELKIELNEKTSRTISFPKCFIGKVSVGKDGEVMITEKGKKYPSFSFKNLRQEDDFWKYLQEKGTKVKLNIEIVDYGK